MRELGPMNANAPHSACRNERFRIACDGRPTDHNDLTALRLGHSAALCPKRWPA
jgi:hypothetical protein